MTGLNHRSMMYSSGDGSRIRIRRKHLMLTDSLSGSVLTGSERLDTNNYIEPASEPHRATA